MVFDFNRTLHQFCQQAPQEVTLVRNAIILELFSSVILDTPVDTGQARGNWQTCAEQPATHPIDRKDPQGATAIAQIAPQLKKANATVFLTNHLPYVEALEFGSSQQAPAGMVRKNRARLVRLLNKAH